VEEPYLVDFEIQYVNNDSTVPVQIRLVNKSTGANTFSWDITEPGKPTYTLSERTPPIITIDTVGLVIIGLTAGIKGTITTAIGKHINVYRNNEIYYFKDIILGGIDLRDSLGCYFSSSSAKVFKCKEISNFSDIQSHLDIAYIGLNGTRFFESPDSVQFWGLPEMYSATTTKIINYIEASNIKFDVNMFDNMKNDSLLLPLNIVPDVNSFGTDVPRIVFFENAYKRRGVIKINEIVPGTKGHIRFDLKIQRYPMIFNF
jgi:hypothetical protein